MKVFTSKFIKWFRLCFSNLKLMKYLLFLAQYEKKKRNEQKFRDVNFKSWHSDNENILKCFSMLIVKFFLKRKNKAKKVCEYLLFVKKWLYQLKKGVNCCQHNAWAFKNMSDMPRTRLEKYFRKYTRIEFTGSRWTVENRWKASFCDDA